MLTLLSVGVAVEPTKLFICAILLSAVLWTALQSEESKLKQHLDGISGDILSVARASCQKRWIRLKMSALSNLSYIAQQTVVGLMLFIFYSQ